MTEPKIDYTVTVDCPKCGTKIDLNNLGSDNEKVVCSECGEEHGTVKALRDRINAAVLKDGKAKILTAITKRRRR